MLGCNNAIFRLLRPAKIHGESNQLTSATQEPNVSQRRELERVIQQHKSWLESSDHRAVSAVDPTTETPPKLSRDAYIRQRLAIHSLLRQSDFVDDSRDAAPEPPPAPAEPALSWTASTVDDPMQEAQNDWNPREPIYPPLADLMDPNILFGLQYGGAPIDFNGWSNPGLAEEVFDEQYMY